MFMRLCTYIVVETLRSSTTSILGLTQIAALFWGKMLARWLYSDTYILMEGVVNSHVY